MPNIDQIADTGLFSINGDTLNIQSVHISESLAAEELAFEINSGGITVKEAWHYFLDFLPDSGVGPFTDQHSDGGYGPVNYRRLNALALLLDERLKGFKLVELIDTLSDGYYWRKDHAAHYSPKTFDNTRLSRELDMYIHMKLLADAGPREEDEWDG